MTKTNQICKTPAYVFFYNVSIVSGSLDVDNSFDMLENNSVGVDSKVQNELINLANNLLVESGVQIDKFDLMFNNNIEIYYRVSDEVYVYYPELLKKVIFTISNIYYSR